MINDKIISKVIVVNKLWIYVFSVVFIYVELGGVDLGCFLD